MTNQDLIDALRAAEAVQFGEFELSHGGTSEYYVDKYLFETDPDCLELVAEAFADRLSADDKLGGVALGGCPSPPRRASPPASPTSSRESNAKDYGTANLIEGRLAEGEEIVVVEDIVTTGTSLVDAAGGAPETRARPSSARWSSSTARKGPREHRGRRCGAGSAGDRERVAGRRGPVAGGRLAQPIRLLPPVS